MPSLQMTSLRRDSRHQGKNENKERQLKTTICRYTFWNSRPIHYEKLMMIKATLARRSQHCFKSSREEFISKLSEALPDARAIEPEHAARAVFQVLEKHVTPGEIRDVIQSLPKEIRILWRQPEVQAQRAL